MPELTILPAVDIADGKAVRLVQGEAGSETDYGSPIDAAKEWVEQGAHWIHLVDLDAAFGRGNNAEVIKNVIHAVRGEVHIELSGGIRDNDSLEAALKTGVARVNLGTAALEDPEWTRRVIGEHGNRIAVGLDVRGTTLAARGWTKEGGDLFETIARLDADGCSRYVVTDVTKDGTLHGPNIHLLKDVAAATRAPIIASGGVSKLEDLHKISEVPDVEGVIIGKALYAGRFTLAEALAAFQPRYDPYVWAPPQP